MVSKVCCDWKISAEKQFRAHPYRLNNVSFINHDLFVYNESESCVHDASQFDACVQCLNLFIDPLEFHSSRRKSEKKFFRVCECWKRLNFRLFHRNKLELEKIYSAAVEAVLKTAFEAQSKIDCDLKAIFDIMTGKRAASHRVDRVISSYAAATGDDAITAFVAEVGAQAYPEAATDKESLLCLLCGVGSALKHDRRSIRHIAVFL